MFLRRFTDFVFQSRLQALMIAFLIAFIPIIGGISILIAALVTLRKGAFEGSLFTIAATIPFIISYLASTFPPSQILIAKGFLIIVVGSNVLTWLLAVILRRFNNWSFTLEAAGLLSILVIGVIHLLFSDIQNWWAVQLTAYFKQATAKLSVDVAQQAVLSEVQARAVAIMKNYATGFIVVSALFIAFLQLLVARWWQAVMFNPGGLRKELYQIRLSRITGSVFIVGLILSFFGNSVAVDAMPVLYAIFFVAGLSLLHAILYQTKNNWLWLVVIYSGVIWLFPFSIVLIAFIALLDTNLCFRR